MGLGIGLAGLCALVVQAQVPLFPEELERVDVIALERDGRDLFAFDALTGRRARIQLELDEQAHFERARGRIGLVLTDRRALAVAPGGGFQELRFQLQEDPPEIALVEEQIALATTARRALGYLASGGPWIETRLSPNERVLALRVGTAAAVVVTSRRVLGLASQARRFVPLDLGVHEELESVSAQDTLVTLRTNRRILVFSAPRASWSEQDRRLR
jgi:hypothetical protein